MSTLFVDTINEKTSGNGVIIPGHVVQIINNAMKTDTQVSTSSSWVDISNLSVTFTPKSSTNKIYIQGHVTCSTNYDASMSIKPVKVIGGTSTADIAIADSAGYRTLSHTGYGYWNNNYNNYDYTQFPITGCSYLEFIKFNNDKNTN